jgi:hypothetical protein
MFDPSAKPWLAAADPEKAKQEYFDAVFGQQSYQTNSSFDLNPFNLAYRADTKQEYYADFAYALFEVGSAFVTGGSGRVLRAVAGVLDELILRD